MRDVSDLLGVRFDFGGRGPDVYDCYGLVQELLRRDGKHAPDVQSQSDRARIAMAMATHIEQFWEPCEKRPGAVALYRIMGAASHVAYVLDDYRMVHCWQGSKTVVIERLADWDRRLVGYYRLKEQQ